MLVWESAFQAMVCVTVSCLFYNVLEAEAATHSLGHRLEFSDPETRC